MAQIRVAKPADCNAILDIYAPFCQPSSPVSFELVPPSPPDIQKQLVITLKNYPWIVYEQSGTVVGYAYADQHQSIGAFDWDVNVHIYLKESVRGKGLGKQLYNFLFDGLRTLGYYNAYANITLPNEAALALHKSVGFTLVGVRNSTAYKGGAWRDVALFALKLQPYAIDPPKPIKFSQLGM